MMNNFTVICPKCGVEMEQQPYKHPYVSMTGTVIHNELVNVYICPCCGRETHILPNDEDGYSAGAGLFSED
jgi:predicted RNA-binding Zn-ribbon protein involved in translation (DUF1610 family)